MTKKRFKFGLAILGGLAAFLLALLVLIFAPTLASAGKGPAFEQDQGQGGHSGHPNPAYFEPPTGGNGPNNGPHHTAGGAGPCVGTPNPCDAHDGSSPGEGPWHYAGGQDDQGGDHGNNSGGGHSSDHDSNGPDGHGYPSLFAGYPGGGGDGGSPHDQSGSCSSKKDKDSDSKDEKSGKKACDSDDDNNHDTGNDGGFQQITLLDDKPGDPSDDPKDNPSNNGVNTDTSSGDGTDDDLPPVDPNCFPFAQSCDTHEGNPPNGGAPTQSNQVPEPLTLSLFAVGLTGAGVLRRRAQQKTAARPD